MHKPFYWTARGAWYVKIDRRNVKLHEDEKKAFDRWEQLRKLADYDSPDATIEAVCEAWLARVNSTTSTQRFAKLVLFCRSFCLHVKPKTKARLIRVEHVRRWLDAPRELRGEDESQWSDAHKKDAGETIKRVFRWAIDQGIFPKSDVLTLKCKSPKPRDSLVDSQTHAALIAETRSTIEASKAFGLFLIALRHSGARPIQVREVTAKHVNSEGDWVFADHKTSAKTKRVLVVRPTPCLATLTKILVAARPKGPLFLTGQGLAWTKDGAALRLRRLKIAAAKTATDVENHELAAKLSSDFTLYSYRHSFVTDSLLSGVDVATVAAILGHVDSSMVSRVYGHLSKHHQHLRDAVARVRRG